MYRAVLACLLIACGPRPVADRGDAPAAPDDAATTGDDAASGDDAVPADTGGGDANRSCAELTVVLRDFRADHPDFEHATSTDDRGLVRAQLGSDGKPVYAHSGPSATVAGPPSFDQWYHDAVGVNLKLEQPLPLVEGPPHTYTFDDQSFFPLDGLGWPNTEVFGHNFLFTTEIHTTFKYRGGEQFRFDGDDDVWVFVNSKLAIDLGGVHVAESGTIDFDARAAELGLAIGGVYALDVFHAERHTDQSHFRMVTTIECIVIE